MALTLELNSQHWQSLSQNFTRCYELFACQPKPNLKCNEVCGESLTENDRVYPVDASIKNFA